MRRTQADFIRFVQKPTVNAMPAFGDQPAQALADVYAYIKSIREPSPPPVQNIPALNDVLKTIP
jgi:cytochrome c1